VSLFGKSCGWRETMRDPQIAIFDARLTVLLLISIFHVRIWTIALALAAVVFFWSIEYHRLPFPSALRFARNWLAGPIRRAVPRNQLRPMIDFGFEGRPGFPREPKFGRPPVYIPAQQ
jgi:intracellular multiplication protein IcmT